jgi:hypothetical protein
MAPQHIEKAGFAPGNGMRSKAKVHESQGLVWAAREETPLVAAAALGALRL